MITDFLTDDEPLVHELDQSNIRESSSGIESLLFLQKPSPLLNRPQGTQGGLLRLGQSSDPRDIEALVGPVASQRAEMLATLQVPERDGPIIPATGQRAAIGTHLERLDGPLMRFSHPHALPAVQLPPAQHSVTASTDHQLSTGSPGHRRDHPRMPRQGVHTLPAVGIPHDELPALSLPLATPRGQPHPIRAPGHPPNGPALPHQPQGRHANSGFPQVDVAMIPPAAPPLANA